MPETGSLPTYADWKQLGGDDSELVHIFEQAGTQFFTVLDPDDAIKQQLRREVSRYLRTVQPTWLLRDRAAFVPVVSKPPLLRLLRCTDEAGRQGAGDALHQ